MTKVVDLCSLTMSNVLVMRGDYGTAVLTSLTTMDALTMMISECSVNQVNLALLACGGTKLPFAHNIR